MIARRFEELDAWQIADELKREVYALTESGPAARDFDFRDQIRNSAASNTKNISEGFGRFRPAPLAIFMEIAVASAMETKDSLKDGIDRGYFTPARIAGAFALVERSIKCSTRLIVYLKSCKKKEGGKRRRQTSNHEQRTGNGNDERRTTNRNDERRTTNRNDERRTTNRNDERRTTNDEPS